MDKAARKNIHLVAGIVFAAFLVIAFLYSFLKARLELEDTYAADVRKSYDETIDSEMKEKFFNNGYNEGLASAEPDEALAAKKEAIEKKLADIKEKALEEMAEFDRKRICETAYVAGRARGENDAKKQWSAEYWDVKTGISLGKLLSIGKKVVRLQLKYRDFPVGAPVEVEVEKDVTVDNEVVCGLMKGFQWANPAAFQFFEGVRKEVCANGRIDKDEIISGEEVNKNFWKSLPQPGPAQ